MSIKKPQIHDSSLDLLKCILVMGVILFHSGFQRFSPTERETVAQLQHFFSFVVLGFFWCAGYLMKRSVGLSELAQKRGGRLLLPFLAVSTVNWMGFLLAQILTQKEFGYALGPKEFLGKIAGLQGVGPQMYFLPYLFFLQLAGFLAEKVIRSDRGLLFLSVILLVGWMVLEPGHVPVGPAYENLPLYLASLFLGMACREWPVERLVPAVYIITPALLAGCAFFPAGLAHALCCFLVPGAIYMTCRGLNAGVGWPGMSGDILSIFIWHTPFLLPLFSILFSSILPIPSFALIPTILLAIGSSILLGRVLSKTPLKAAFGG